MSDNFQKAIEEAQKQAMAQAQAVQQQMMVNAQMQAQQMQRSLLAAQGYSEEEINQFLNQTNEQIAGLQQQAFSNTDSFISNLLGSETEKAEFVASHPQPAECAKYLAIGAIFMCMRDEPVETLEIMDDDIEEYKEDIEESWGITDHDSSVEMIESLLNGRTYVNINNTYQELRSGKREGIDDDDLSNFLATVESLVESLNLSRSEIVNCPSTIAWDIERAGFLARVCTHMGYISAEEAWGYLERAGKVSREHFTNWQDYCISIVMGRALTMGYHESYFYAFEEMLVDTPEFLNSIPIESF